MEGVDEFIQKLIDGNRVERHSHDISGYVIEELENMGWLNRDGCGYLVAGEMLKLHHGLPDE